jgi:hypothetical protein
MSPLKPVDPDYRPRYPRELTEAEVRNLLRPSLLRRFSKKALVAGALAAGTALAPSPLHSQDVLPKLPKAGTSTRTNDKFQAEVFAMLDEALPKKGGFWASHTSIVSDKELQANPPLKYPLIRISYGNSCLGIFDTEAAKAAAAKLFRQYGIELRKDVPIKGDGYEFTADGYDEKLRIGFKLVMPDGPVGLGRQRLEPEPPQKNLDAAEMTKLDADVEAGKMRMLVIKADEFPNMDGDLRTPMLYYLNCVMDYLNWVHGDKQIDPTALHWSPHTRADN